MPDLALETFGIADFDWTTRLDAVWQDTPYDVPELHAAIRQEMLREVLRLAGGEEGFSPLGRVVTAPAGSGKTHLLATLRRKLARSNANFILVDMTDVRDFWETILLGFMRSMQRSTTTALPQYQRWLEGLIMAADIGVDPSAHRDKLSTANRDDLLTLGSQILNGLLRRYRKQALDYQDIIRALLGWQAADFELVNLADSWLQAQRLEEEERRMLGIKIGHQHPIRVIEGLSWIAGLTGPTLLALDQMDSIIEQKHLLARGNPKEGDLSEEQRAAQSIIESIAGGLSALIDHSSRTLTVISCLESTWNAIREGSLASHLDRYRPPESLGVVNHVAQIQGIVGTRLERAFLRKSYRPDYPTWPFHPEALRTLEGLRPREILKHCEDYRQLSLRRGEVEELLSFSGEEINPPIEHQQPLTELDAEYERLCEIADTAETLKVENEEELGGLLQVACRCLLLEIPSSEAMQAELEVEFPSSHHYSPLHARLILGDPGSGGQNHVSFRVLQQTHARAYSARLGAAMTAAGIDANLSFRRLVIIRTTQIITKGATGEYTQRFEQAGGKFVELDPAEVRSLWAIDALARQYRHDFQTWLQERRPLSQLKLFQQTVPELARFSPGAEALIEPKERSLDAAPVIQPTRVKSETGQLSRSDGESAANRSILAARGASESGMRATAVAEPGAAKTAAGSSAERSLAEVPPPTAAEAPPAAAEAAPPSSTPPIAANRTAAESSANDARPAPSGVRIVIGERFDREGVAVGLPLASLSEHIGILGGSGSGKSVLIRRLIEECALQGIPTIALSQTSEFARLGDPWPRAPKGWQPQDAGKAIAYRTRTKLRLWTPGRSLGRPLPLPALPDFTAHSIDLEGLKAAKRIALSYLAERVGATDSNSRRQVLDEALEQFIADRKTHLGELVALLAELPSDIAAEVRNGRNLAAQMAEKLRLALSADPLLRDDSAPISPNELFGVGDSSVRISAINLRGLESLDLQRELFTQLCFSLWSWLLEARPRNHGLVGLLIIDELRDFLPPNQDPACKQALLKLLEVGRERGLGIVVSTQKPKGLDLAALDGIGAWFYGRANAPQTIDQISKHLAQRGGSAGDIGRLQPGQLYLSAPFIAPPVKLIAPMCLSHHPETRYELSDEEIMKRAVQG